MQPTPRYPRIATPVAHHLARRVIEQRMQAQGLRITRYATVVEQALVYLAEHREELMEQALARVRASAWYSAMAAQEERQRIREQRKLARAENPCRPVAQSDHDKAGTDIVDVSGTTSAIFRRS